MSVLGTSFRTNLQQSPATSANKKGVFGKPFWSFIAGSVLALGIALGVSTAPANALSLTFNLDTVHSEDDFTPEGDATAWVVATFEDYVINNVAGLMLTLETSGLVDKEHLKMFEFNVGRSVETTASYQDGVEARGVQYDEDGINNGGGDGFDAAVLYFNSMHSRFGANSFSKYFFSNLTLDDVNRMTGSGLYVSAHIGSVGDAEDSVWITGVPSPIPLPPSALLFLSGLAGMVLLARRRRAKPAGAAALYRDRAA